MSHQRRHQLLAQKVEECEALDKVTSLKSILAKESDAYETLSTISDGIGNFLSKSFLDLRIAMVACLEDDLILKKLREFRLARGTSKAITSAISHNADKIPPASEQGVAASEIAKPGSLSSEDHPKMVEKLFREEFINDDYRDKIAGKLDEKFSRVKIDIINKINEALDEKYTADRRTLLNIKENFQKDASMYRESAEIFRKSYDTASRNRQAEGQRILELSLTTAHNAEVEKLKSEIGRLEYDGEVLKARIEMKSKQCSNFEFLLRQMETEMMNPKKKKGSKKPPKVVNPIFLTSKSTGELGAPGGNEDEDKLKEVSASSRRASNVALMDSDVVVSPAVSGRRSSRIPADPIQLPPTSDKQKSPHINDQTIEMTKVCNDLRNEIAVLKSTLNESDLAVKTLMAENQKLTSDISNIMNHYAMNPAPADNSSITETQTVILTEIAGRDKDELSVESYHSGKEKSSSKLQSPKANKHKKQPLQAQVTERKENQPKQQLVNPNKKSNRSELSISLHSTDIDCIPLPATLQPLPSKIASSGNIENKNTNAVVSNAVELLPSKEDKLDQLQHIDDNKTLTMQAIDTNDYLLTYSSEEGVTTEEYRDIHGTITENGMHPSLSSHTRDDGLPFRRDISIPATIYLDQAEILPKLCSDLLPDSSIAALEAPLILFEDVSRYTETPTTKHLNDRIYAESMDRTFSDDLPDIYVNEASVDDGSSYEMIGQAKDQSGIDTSIEMTDYGEDSIQLLSVNQHPNIVSDSAESFKESGQIGQSAGARNHFISSQVMLPFNDSNISDDAIIRRAEDVVRASYIMDGNHIHPYVADIYKLLVKSVESQMELKKIIFSLEYQNKKLVNDTNSREADQDSQSRLHQLQLKERGLLLRMLADETNRVRSEREFFKKRAEQLATQTSKRNSVDKVAVESKQLMFPGIKVDESFVDTTSGNDKFKKNGLPKIVSKFGNSQGSAAAMTNSLPALPSPQATIDVDQSTGLHFYRQSSLNKISSSLINRNSLSPSKFAGDERQVELNDVRQQIVGMLAQQMMMKEKKKKSSKFMAVKSAASNQLEGRSVAVKSIDEASKIQNRIKK